jgi:hypothetical protein
MESAMPNPSRRKTRERGHAGKRLASAIAIVVSFSLLVLEGDAGASHGPGDGPRIYGVGSGSNQFIFVVGESRLSIAAHLDELGRPNGHATAQGEPDDAGPFESFFLEGEVTCINVVGNRAAIKYRFRHAEGSGEPFEGGGVQVFLEDNGDPRKGIAVDKSAFDDPQVAGVFNLTATVCGNPTLKAYDQLESGNFVVHS